MYSTGTVALPLFSGYSMSKFGLEALSDMLRLELKDQGIKVWQHFEGLMAGSAVYHAKL